MRNEDKDMFTLVRDTLEAIRRKDYVVGIATGSRSQNKRAFLVKSQGFATSNIRFVKGLELASGILHDQLTEEERHRVPIDFEFSSTPIDEGCCFYIKHPPDWQIDFDKARDLYNHYKEMFTPKRFPILDKDPSRVYLGPLSEGEARVFNYLIINMLTLHGEEGLDYKPLRVSAGIVIGFDKDQYAHALRNKEILKASGLYEDNEVNFFAPGV